MPDSIYPKVTAEIAKQRREIVPGQYEAFHDFSTQVFAAGALDVETKHLIAVAVAHVTQCPYCIAGHTKAVLQAGASRQQIMEAIWVAAEMRGGGFRPLGDRDSHHGGSRRLRQRLRPDTPLPLYDTTRIHADAILESRGGETPTFSNDQNRKLPLMSSGLGGHSPAAE